jgi:hypothetical protein
MRISRGNLVIGDRSLIQIKKGIADSTLLPTDSYYDEETSEWLPLASFLSQQTLPKQPKPVGRACYCGSGLPYQVCHGDGNQY